MAPLMERGGDTERKEHRGRKGMVKNKKLKHSSTKEWSGFYEEVRTSQVHIIILNTHINTPDRCGISRS